jgi:hypothetical protein
MPFEIDVTSVTAVTLTSNLTAPASVGTTVIWSAKPSGGAVPYEYQWSVYDGTSWATATL